MSDHSCGLGRYVNKGVYIRGTYAWIGRLIEVTDMDLTIDRASMVNSSGDLFPFVQGNLEAGSLDVLPAEHLVTIDRAGLDVTNFPVKKLPVRTS